MSSLTGSQEVDSRDDADISAHGSVPLSPSRSSIGSSGLRFQEEISILGYKVFSSALPVLTKIAESVRDQDVEELLLTESDLEKLDPKTLGLVYNINELVKHQFSTLNTDSVPTTLEDLGHLCILKTDLEFILGAANGLQKLSPEKWNAFEDLDDDLSSISTEILSMKICDVDTEIPQFVEDFNSHYRAREQYREDALALLHQLKNQVWIYEDGCQKIPKATEVANARSALMQMYRCDDVLVKETAMVYLTEILDCDPLVMDSAYNLVELQTMLYEEVKATNSQNLNTRLQRLLIKAYAISIECILLHAAAKHLNAMTDETKELIWSAAEELQDFNITKDEEIEFWSKYAIQGAQHIKTSTGAVMQWLKRVALVARAGIQVAAVAKEPGEVSGLLTGAFMDLREAFHHIEWHKSWFEELLILKKLSRYSIYNIDSFHSITTSLQKRKRDEPSEKLLYGIASILEYSVLNSPSSAIQEEGIKVLLQFYTIDNDLIRSRIIHAFKEMLNSKMLRLRNTSYLVLKLLQASQKGFHIKNQTEIQGLPQIEDLPLDDLYPEGKHVVKTGIYENVIKFLIRRLAEIKEEEDYGGHSFVTLLSSSKEDKVIPHLMQCFTELSNEFQEPDIYGRSAYHIAALRKNISIIPHIRRHMNININAQEFKSLNTALHIAAEEQSLDMVDILLSDCHANPDIQNRDGNTALHLAAKEESYAIAAQLLEHGADPNKTDNQGDTPMNIAIENDNVDMVDLFQKYDAKVSEDVHHLSPIIIAAQQRSEKTLKYLIENKKGPLTALEALEILRMISEDGDGISCTEDFCRFHIRRENTQSNYARAFTQYRSFPQPRLGTKNSVILTGVKKKGLLSRKVSPERRALTKQKTKRGFVDIPPSMDDFGNTDLIHMAKRTDCLELLTETLSDTESINTPNYLGLMPLHAAVYARNAEAVALLLEKNSNLDESDIQGYTPLHFAAYNHNRKIMEMLLEAGANPSRQNNNGDTPLLILCGNFPDRKPKTVTSINLEITPSDLSFEDDIVMIEMLVKAGAAPLAQDFMGNSALHHAAQYGPDETIKHLFTTYPQMLWQKNNKGLISTEEAIRIHRGIKTKALMSDTTPESLVRLHQEYIDQTQNQITLGNLLAHAGEVECFETLIKHENSIAYHQDGTRLKETPLHIAGREGQIDILNIYLANRLKIDMEDGFGNSPLHHAALNDRIDFVVALIRAKVCVHQKNHDGRTALHLAATRDYRECVDTLLEHRNNIAHIQDGHGDTALHLACKYGANNAASRLIQSFDHVDRYVNDNGNTPFHIACSNGNDNIAVDLLAAGADIEARDIFGNTPLLLAAQQGHLSTIKFLIQNGADIAAQDDEGETVLHKAVFNHHHKVVKKLLEKDRELFIPEERALVRQVDLKGETSLHELTKRKVSPEFESKQENILIELINGGSELGHKNELGETFLHLICHRGFNNLLVRLISHFEDVSKKPYSFSTEDHRGNHPLHLACQANQKNIVDTLISTGVELNHKNKDEMTPLLIAIQNGHFGIARKLLDVGANVSKSDAKGQNILHHLLANPNLSVNGIALLKRILKQDPTLLRHKDKQENRPLHILAENNQVSALKIALRYLPGRKIEKKKRLVWKLNSEGLSSYDIAQRMNFHELSRGITHIDHSELGVAVVDRYRRKKFLLF